MAAIYKNLIIKGKKQYADVPENLKKDVKALLIEEGYENLVEGD